MSSPQILDAGPRGSSNLENMAAMSNGTKKTISFFHGDAEGTSIGSHTVYDFHGKAQAVGMVQTWNQVSRDWVESGWSPGYGRGVHLPLASLARRSCAGERVSMRPCRPSAPRHT
jgi:hypothetical protein